jgi:DNA-binding PadR family transcriptional regulator
MAGDVKLSKAQRYWLQMYIHGWTIRSPSLAAAPIRRLIKRGLIEKTGVVRGRPYFQATDAGRAALTRSQP